LDESTHFYADWGMKASDFYLLVKFRVVALCGNRGENGNVRFLTNEINPMQANQKKQIRFTKAALEA